MRGLYWYNSKLSLLKSKSQFRILYSNQ